MSKSGKQTIRELTAKIEASLPEVSKISADGEVLANTTILGDIGRRIFTYGQRSDGASLGNYTSPPYKQKREKAGRQINFVDLQFSGDLFNSIQVGMLNGRPAVGIISTKEADISVHLEERYKGPIFQASAEERAIAMETCRQYVNDRLRKLMRSWY